jgi:hypothetical protein
MRGLEVMKKMKSPNIYLALFFLFTIASCSSQDPHTFMISNTPLQLSSKQIILKPDQPLSRLNSSLSIRIQLKEAWQPEPPWKQIRLSDGTMVTIGAILVSADGTKYLPATIGSAGGLDICFISIVPKDKKIIKIELTSSHPLTALEVEWVDQNLK